MGDDWDPFAIEGESSMTVATEETLTTQSTGQPRIFRKERDVVSTELLKRLDKAKPWKAPKKTGADLMFHTQTHSVDDWQHVDVLMKVGNKIVYVIFNRPTENNSMQETLGAGINDSLLALHARPDIRVAVFTAEGRMYCAGGDPKGWQAQAASMKSGEWTGDGTVGVRIPMKPQSPEVYQHMGNLVMKAFQIMGQAADAGRLGAAKQWDAWAKLPQFTICLANGSAMGGGVGCVCCCDYVISVKKAYFVLSEVKIGVIPATISPYVVSKLGESNSKRFFCAAENLQAPRAKELGIVNEVVADMKEGHERIKEICETMSKCGPYAVKAAKELCFATASRAWDETLIFQLTGMHAVSADGTEATQASGGSTPWETDKIGFDEWPDVGVVEKKKKA